MNKRQMGNWQTSLQAENHRQSQAQIVVEQT